MGSDLHMSPPTPDEYRIVRSGKETAIYRRHTDAIYSQGTNTWFRHASWHDPDGSAFSVAKELHPSWGVIAFDHKVELEETLERQVLETPDRNFDREIEEARQAAIRARERSQRYFEEAITLEMKLRELEQERDRA